MVTVRRRDEARRVETDRAKLTRRHDPRRGHRHHRDVLGGVRLVQVSSHHAQWCAPTAAFLLGDHTHPGPRLHRPRDGEDSRGVMGRGGGGCGGVGEGGRAGLLGSELLLGFVQEHGVLHLRDGEEKGGERREGEVTEQKGG